ncbi:MAG: hypothetical protein OXH52_20795 [Gammaproteobacteria bacterium]|nr:hypothetical protein [Gammaproteobacteria bacterium]
MRVEERHARFREVLSGERGDLPDLRGVERATGHRGARDEGSGVDGGEHGQRGGDRWADVVPVDGEGAIDMAALQGKERLVPGKVPVQHGGAAIVGQPRVDQRLALGRRAFFVVRVDASVHGVGVAGIQFHCPI